MAKATGTDLDILPFSIARLRLPVALFPAAARTGREKSAPPTVAGRGPEKPDKDTEETRQRRVLAGDALS